MADDTEDTKGHGPSAETQRINEDADELQERALKLAKAQLGDDAPVHELNKRVEDILLNYGAHVPEMSEEQLQAQRDANVQIDGTDDDDDDDDGHPEHAADDSEPGNAQGGVLTQAKADAAVDRSTLRPSAPPA